MTPGRRIYRTVIQLAQKPWLLFQTLGTAVSQWRRQAVLDAMEAERLDRIRNPSKYRGKS